LIHTPNRFASLGVIHIQSFGFGHLFFHWSIFADKHIVFSFKKIIFVPFIKVR